MIVLPFQPDDPEWPVTIFKANDAGVLGSCTPEIRVALQDAEQARELLKDLEQRSGRGSLDVAARKRHYWRSRIPMIAIVWQFDVKRGQEDAFERFYGVDGDWTAMNRQTRSYLGASFLRDQSRSSRYILVEYWSEMVLYEQHRAHRSDAFTQLESRRSVLLESVEPLGIFTALDVPSRFGPTWSQRRTS